MKKVFILLSTLPFIASCSYWEENEKLPNIVEMKEICNSESVSNSEEYCLWKKVFSMWDYQVIWTCRSFSKYNNFFDRHEKLCKKYWKNRVVCRNSDGSINEGCN